jgi:hypothetical protein
LDTDEAARAVAFAGKGSPAKDRHAKDRKKSRYPLSPGAEFGAWACIRVLAHGLKFALFDRTPDLIRRPARTRDDASIT